MNYNDKAKVRSILVRRGSSKRHRDIAKLLTSVSDICNIYIYIYRES